MSNDLPKERRNSGASPLRALPAETSGTPVPDSKAEQPPVIRRAEVVAFALVALLVIAIVTVLYFAKAFFLPVATAFVVGTMLSPAAGYLEKRHIPRSVSAVLIVIVACAGVAFIVGLIASPLMEWSTRLPELGALLKEKMHMFDRPLALLAAAAGHARRLRNAAGLAVPDAEIRMGAAHLRIPVADLHRIPAVRRHADPVHRKLAGSAPGADHDLCRPRYTAAHACGFSTRSKAASAATS